MDYMKFRSLYKEAADPVPGIKKPEPPKVPAAPAKPDVTAQAKAQIPSAPTAGSVNKPNYVNPTWNAYKPTPFMERVDAAAKAYDTHVKSLPEMERGLWTLDPSKKRTWMQERVGDMSGVTREEQAYYDSYQLNPNAQMLADNALGRKQALPGMPGMPSVPMPRSYTNPFQQHTEGSNRSQVPAVTFDPTNPTHVYQARMLRQQQADAQAAQRSWGVPEMRSATPRTATEAVTQAVNTRNNLERMKSDLRVMPRGAEREKVEAAVATGERQLTQLDAGIAQANKNMTNAGFGATWLPSAMGSFADKATFGVFGDLVSERQKGMEYVAAYQAQRDAEQKALAEGKSEDEARQLGQQAARETYQEFNRANTIAGYGGEAANLLWTMGGGTLLHSMKFHKAAPTLWKMLNNYNKVKKFTTTAGITGDLIRDAATDFGADQPTSAAGQIALDAWNGTSRAIRKLPEYAAIGAGLEALPGMAWLARFAGKHPVLGGGAEYVAADTGITAATAIGKEVAGKNMPGMNTTSEDYTPGTVAIAKDVILPAANDGTEAVASLISPEYRATRATQLNYQNIIGTINEQGQSAVDNKILTSWQSAVDSKVETGGDAYSGDAGRSKALYETARDFASTHGYMPQGFWSSDDFKAMTPEQRSSLYKEYCTGLGTAKFADGGAMKTLWKGMTTDTKDPKFQQQQFQQLLAKDKGFRAATQAVMPQLFQDAMNSNTGMDPANKTYFSAYLGTLSDEQMQASYHDMFYNMNADQGVRLMSMSAGNPDDKQDPQLKRLSDFGRATVQKHMVDDANYFAQTMPALLDKMKKGEGDFASTAAMTKDFMKAVEAAGGAEKWMTSMTTDNFLAFGKHFATPAGAEMLKAMGEDGHKLMAGFQSAAQNVAFQKWKEDPLRTHQFAGLWLRSKGMGGLADLAENPMLFYGGVALLFAGGAATLGGLLGSDDDDEDEDDETAYKRRYKQTQQTDFYEGIARGM